MINTSISHPLRIAEVPAGPRLGSVGVTFCPGKVQMESWTGPWHRDLTVDIQAVRNWGAAAVITVMEQSELDWLQVSELGAVVGTQGMMWVHLPVQDVRTLNKVAEDIWSLRGPDVRGLIRNGRNVVFHCRGGLGRSGMMAARTLVELGWEPSESIKAVRRERPGAIETTEQEEIVRQARRMDP